MFGCLHLGEAVVKETARPDMQLLFRLFLSGFFTSDGEYPFRGRVEDPKQDWSCANDAVATESYFADGARLSLAAFSSEFRWLRHIVRNLRLWMRAI